MSDLDTDFTVVVPPDLHLAPAALRRLERSLVATPEAAGAVALVEAIPPGSSADVHAERRAAGGDGAPRTTSAPVVGAAVLRDPSALAAVLDREIVPATDLLIDPQAVAHDPWAPVVVDEASPLGRPPYRRRPVALFLATADDIAAADTARGMVNGLVRRGVEARLAVPVVPPGLHLTRPCTPDESAVVALRPDVVVAMDAGAVASASQWCRGLRSTVVVELTAEVTARVDLVPWHLGRPDAVAGDRLRARIGRLTGSDALAALVNRLCSGPQPAPPAPDEVVVPLPRSGQARPAAGSAPDARVAALDLVVGGGRPHAVLDPLAEHLARAGARVSTVTDRTQRRAAADADVLLVATPAPTWLRRVVTTRRDRGRRTAVVVAPADLRADASAVHDLVAAAGAAIAPDLGSARSLRRLATTLALRPLLPPSEIEQLVEAGERRQPVSAPLLGWVVGADGGPSPLAGSGPPPALASVSAAVVDLLARRPDLWVEVVDHTGALPRALRDHPQVAFLAEVPGPARLASWSTMLWCPDPVDLAATGDVDVVTRARLAGVPTVLSDADASVTGGSVDATLVVTDVRDARAWEHALARLLDDPAVRAAAATDTAAAGAALAGTDAATPSLVRVAGWLERLGRATEADR